MAVSVAATLGVNVGQVPTAELSWAKFHDVASEETGLPLYLLIPSAIAIAITSFLNLVLARARVAKAYIDGEDLKVSRIDRDDSSQADALGCGGGVVQIFTFSLGLTALPAAVGGLVGSSSQAASAPLQWPILLFVAGFLLLGAGAVLFTKVQDHTVAEWRHPYPLPRRRPSTTSLGSRRPFRQAHRARR